LKRHNHITTHLACINSAGIASFWLGRGSKVAAGNVDGLSFRGMMMRMESREYFAARMSEQWPQLIAGVGRPHHQRPSTAAIRHGRGGDWPRAADWGIGRNGV